MATIEAWGRKSDSEILKLYIMWLIFYAMCNISDLIKQVQGLTSVPAERAVSQGLKACVTQGSLHVRPV